jgi:malate dehydrogenase
MSTVCILGAGELGGAVADALARGERVARVILIDAAGTVAAGKALDMQQTGAVAGYHTRLEGSSDFTRVAGCSVCVVADRTGPASVEWHGDDGFALLTRLLPYIDVAPIVFAGTAQADLLGTLAREARVPRRQLIGSAPEALASAITAIVAMEAGCSPAEVRLTVLGSPPSGFVVPWSEASIGGLSLERVLTQVQLNRLEGRVSRLWPPGPFTLGLAAARATEAIVLSSRRAHSVLMVLGGEFGVRGKVAAVPSLLTPEGITQTRVPTLSTRERVLLETALGA